MSAAMDVFMAWYLVTRKDKSTTPRCIVSAVDSQLATQTSGTPLDSPPGIT